MHAEQQPSSGMGWTYYNIYCLLERQIMIFIYYGQAPHSQLLQVEHSVLCSIYVERKLIYHHGCGLWTVA